VPTGARTIVATTTPTAGSLSAARGATKPATPTARRCQTPSLPNGIDEQAEEAGISHGEVVSECGQFSPEPAEREKRERERADRRGACGCSAARVRMRIWSGRECRCTTTRTATSTSQPWARTISMMTMLTTVVICSTSVKCEPSCGVCALMERV
jgi:hypothetical protein